MTDSVDGSLILPLSAAAPGEARRFIRRHLAIGDQRDSAELLVSELVTNAVSYSRGKVELVVRVLGTRIRVEVGDASAAPPVIRAPDLEGGRGLHLVEAIADRWGVEQRVDSKSVWFEIPAGDDPLHARPRRADDGRAPGSGMRGAGSRQPAPPDPEDATSEARDDRRHGQADGTWLRSRWHHPAGRR